MKKYVLAISVILCTVMLGMAIAQEKAKEQQKPDKAPMPTAITQTGEVLSVDPTKNEIVIKDDTGAEIHFLIGTSTKITREGKAISLGDVKAGDRVTGECEQSADGCKAKSTVVIPAAPSFQHLRRKHRRWRRRHRNRSRAFSIAHCHGN